MGRNHHLLGFSPNVRRRNFGACRLNWDRGTRFEKPRLIEMFRPCSARLNTTVRKLLGRIADELSHNDTSQGDAGTNEASSPLAVFLDGAHIRCRPEYQKRHLNGVVGKVESLNMSRRFGFVQQAAASPARQLRNDLIAQGWDGRNKVTVISDGKPDLPNLMRRAGRGPVTHILDWWHISMRVKHIEMQCKDFCNQREFRVAIALRAPCRNTALGPLARQVDDRRDNPQTSPNRL